MKTNMNDLFNAKRFGRLFIKHTTEHYKTYLMSLLVLVGVLLLGGGFLIYMLDAPLEVGLQTAMFGGIYFLAGTMFTSTIFADFGDQKRALPSLMLPASNFEKFLVGWLFSFVIFSVVYTATFYLILLILINLQHIPNAPHKVIDVFAGQYVMIFVIFALLHSITIFGAIFFKKLHFIKTAFCFFISAAMATLLNTIFLQLLLGHRIRPAIPFGFVVMIEDNVTPIEGSNISAMMIIWMIIAIALIFWVAAYYRLKEKQV
jgi:hypothetical protein